MQTQYFSFVGELEAPETRDPELAAMADSLIGFAEWETSPFEFCEMLGAIRPVPVVSGIDAVAVIRGDQALLVVWADHAEWCESGVVVWPLRFTAPAAVAGACCAPQYGLT